MIRKLTKKYNSPALMLNIPKEIAEAARLEPGDFVKIEVLKDGSIKIWKVM